MDIKRSCGFSFLLILFMCMGVVCTGIRAVYCDASKRNKIVPINVAGIELEIELATTPEEHILGLMYRDRLGDNEGMLFVFPNEKHLSFWMKDTRIPLSIAFINADGRIVQIESMKPYSLDTHVSREKAKYALEMNDGWFKTHKVKEDDMVKIPLTSDDKKMTGNAR